MFLKTKTWRTIQQSNVYTPSNVVLHTAHYSDKRKKKLRAVVKFQLRMQKANIRILLQGSMCISIVLMQ